MRVLNQLRFLMLLLCVILAVAAWGGYHDAQDRKSLRQALDAHGVRVAAVVEKLTWKKDEPLADVTADIAYATPNGQTVHAHVPISQVAKDGLKAASGKPMLDVRYLPESPGRVMWVEEEPDDGIFSLWLAEATGSLLFLLAALQPQNLPILVLALTGVRLIREGDNHPDAVRRARAGRLVFASIFALVILGVGVAASMLGNMGTLSPSTILISAAVLAVGVFLYLVKPWQRGET